MILYVKLQTANWSVRDVTFALLFLRCQPKVTILLRNPLRVYEALQKPEQFQILIT
jgi:hypothetical protein